MVHYIWYHSSIWCSVLEHSVGYQYQTYKVNLLIKHHGRLPTLVSNDTAYFYSLIYLFIMDNGIFIPPRNRNINLEYILWSIYKVDDKMYIAGCQLSICTQIIIRDTVNNYVYHRHVFFNNVYICICYISTHVADLILILKNKADNR